MSTHLNDILYNLSPPIVTIQLCIALCRDTGRVELSLDGSGGGGGGGRLINKDKKVFKEHRLYYQLCLEYCYHTFINRQ